MHAVTVPYVQPPLLGKGCWSRPSGTVRNGTPWKIMAVVSPDPKTSPMHELRSVAPWATPYRFGAPATAMAIANRFLASVVFVNPSRPAWQYFTANAIWRRAIPAAWRVRARLPTSRRCGCGGQGLGIPLLCHPHGLEVLRQPAGLPAASQASAARRASGTGSDPYPRKTGLGPCCFWLQILAVRRCSVG